ncbi:hypothetical protein [Nocardia sp. CNY236]|uniref:hypothetical protein n=1 Tax=Nocardia sp. CNY236 TaxID=1169152 RepID=UPI0003FDBE24|nr:hypothetical protein [Nocardia sp. CNY236]
MKKMALSYPRATVLGALSARPLTFGELRAAAGLSEDAAEAALVTLDRRGAYSPIP